MSSRPGECGPTGVATGAPPLVVGPIAASSGGESERRLAGRRTSRRQPRDSISRKASRSPSQWPRVPLPPVARPHSTVEPSDSFGEPVWRVRAAGRAPRTAGPSQPDQVDKRVYLPSDRRHGRAALASVSAWHDGLYAYAAAIGDPSGAAAPVPGAVSIARFHQAKWWSAVRRDQPRRQPTTPPVPDTHRKWWGPSRARPEPRDTSWPHWSPLRGRSRVQLGVRARPAG